MAADERAEPCELGMGPITGEEGSATGAATFGGAEGSGAVLQAEASAAAALETSATSQKRRGAIFRGSCLMVDGCEFVLIQLLHKAGYFA